MAEIKAIFQFFKMHGCGACDRFNASSVWQELSTDKDLKAAGIIFPKTEFGVVQENGKYVRKALSPRYVKLISVAPSFILEKPGSNPIVYDSYEGDRSFVSMKTWLLNTVRKEKYNLELKKQLPSIHSQGNNQVINQNNDQVKNENNAQINKPQEKTVRFISKTRK